MRTHDLEGIVAKRLDDPYDSRVKLFAAPFPHLITPRKCSGVRACSLAIVLLPYDRRSDTVSLDEVESGKPGLPPAASNAGFGANCL
jgi:hypothetical protein